MITVTECPHFKIQASVLWNQINQSDRFPNYFVFSKIAFSVKNGTLRDIFHIDSARYRAFSPSSANFLKTDRTMHFYRDISHARDAEHTNWAVNFR